MWRKQKILLVVVCLVIGVSSALLFSGRSYATAGINSEMSFEGKLVNSSGVNIANGTYNMEFKIYAGGTATGGGTLNWTEDYLVSNTQAVTFSGGTFQVNLGSICTFTSGVCAANGITNTAINWNTYPLYLSMQIGSTTSCTPSSNFTANCGGDGEMSPYILLTSTPYAMNANQLGGLGASSFAQLGAASQTFTGANIFQPTSNVAGVTILQNSAGSPTADIFDVQTANATNIIQIAGPSANNANVTINPVGSGNSLSLGTNNASNTINIGSTALSTGTQTINVGNSNTSGGTTNVVIGAGTTATGGTTTINGKSGITIQSGSGAVSLGTSTILSTSGALTVSSGGTSALNFDTSSSSANIIIGATNAPVIQVGSNSNVNTTQHLLQLNSVNTLAEGASCTTSTNQGALYYNNQSNSVRACINGSWQDLVSTQDLALQLFGVVPNSGNKPGDLIGASATSTSSSDTGGPCKINWASTTTVYVNSCLAYSGGREVNVAATTLTPAGAASTYQNICLNASGVPALLGTASGTLGSQTLTNLTTTNSTTYGQPLLCLGTVLLSSSSKISAIYDARTFTTTTKSYATIATATNAILGGIVSPDTGTPGDGLVM
jgi:hypothetical protein